MPRLVRRSCHSDRARETGCSPPPPGAVAEDGERLGLAEEVDQRARCLADGGFTGDDASVGAADMDDASARGEVLRGHAGEDRAGLLPRLAAVVELSGDQGGDHLHVAGRVDQGVLAQRRRLDRDAGAQDHDEDADEQRDSRTEGGLEALEALIQRMGQRARYTQNRIGAHGCALRVGTRHARSPFGTLPSVRSGDVPHPRESQSVESARLGLSSLELSQPCRMRPMVVSIARMNPVRVMDR